jgi:prepilin-type N-terminal cleavage/methylation domain-containing protein
MAIKFSFTSSAKKKDLSQKGFTIIELMIASMVFSVLIIMVSAVTLGVAKQYQKATYTAQLNDSSRNVHQTLSQTIGYGGEYDKLENLNGYYGFCSGKTRIFYKPSTSSSINSGLYKDILDDTEDCSTSIPNAVDFGVENLLPKNGFVTNLSIDSIGSGNTYNVSTTFKVGTADMFVDSDIAKNCLPTLKGGDFCTEVTYTNVVTAKIR